MNTIIIVLLFATVSFGFRNTRGYQRTQLGDSVDKASMKILKESFQDSEDKNVIASPLGALILLSMYSAGTKEKSREEIMQLLGSTDYKQLEESYSNLTKRFSAMDPSYLVLANKMYVSDMYALDDSFANVAADSYKSEVEQVDFTQRNETAESINKWTEERTKGRMKSSVNEDVIDEDTVIALLNVIFFQGHWNVPFNASNTEQKDFYVDELTTIKKPMMKLQMMLFYHEDADLDARMVELPYKEKGFRMVVVLPNKRGGLLEVLEKLVQRGLLDVFSFSTFARDVALEMPKFEIKNSLDLKKILSQVGVSHMFSEGTRGVVREREVTVSKAIQEAFVKVDEEGATAGAFTDIFITSRSYKTPLEFKADHPFMFAILHEDIVVFTGTYAH